MPSTSCQKFSLYLKAREDFLFWHSFFQLPLPLELPSLDVQAWLFLMLLQSVTWFLFQGSWLDLHGKHNV